MRLAITPTAGPVVDAPEAGTKRGAGQNVRPLFTPSQGDNPNTTLTRPQVINSLTLVRLMIGAAPKSHLALPILDSSCVYG